MKTITHYRKENVIRNASTGKDEVFKSINKAKKASRKLQQSSAIMSVVASFPQNSSAAFK
jgi:hypothetical protein